jgi:sulfite exporter TauE/SafE
MFLWTALLIGLVGSLHCIGMCGPIAIALPLGKTNIISKLVGGLIYNTGRIITYMILGAVFGLIGKGIHIAGMHQWVSMVIGVMMIGSVVMPLFFRQRLMLNTLFSGYSERLTSQFRKYFKQPSMRSFLIIGLLNGLLPCGLVYVAIAGAIQSKDTIAGVAYMAAFGIGTMPALLAVSILGSVISITMRNAVRKVVPYFIVVLGILFILRGMSLGIPYISPKSEVLTTSPKAVDSCCHKY